MAWCLNIVRFSVKRRADWAQLVLFLFFPFFFFSLRLLSLLWCFPGGSPTIQVNFCRAQKKRKGKKKKKKRPVINRPKKIKYKKERISGWTRRCSMGRHGKSVVIPPCHSIATAPVCPDNKQEPLAVYDSISREPFPQHLLWHCWRMSRHTNTELRWFVLGLWRCWTMPYGRLRHLHVSTREKGRRGKYVPRRSETILKTGAWILWSKQWSTQSSRQKDQISSETQVIWRLIPTVQLLLPANSTATIMRSHGLLSVLPSARDRTKDLRN